MATSAAPVPAPTKHRPGSRSNERGDRRFGLMLVLPAAAIVGLLFVYPIGYTGWLSLHDVLLTRPDVEPFVGGANYRSLLTSGEFWAATGRTAYFTVLTVGLGVLLALGLAILLAQEFRGRAIARTLLLVPWAVPPVVNGVMWKSIYDSNWGVANALIKSLGLTDGNVAWLGTQRSALNALVFAELWKLLPFLTLLLLAALQNVAKNLYKAARIDGASAWKQFLHITLPGIRYPLMLTLIVQTLWSIKVFDTVYVLTSGGPARGTTMLNYFGYLQTFKFLNIGYGAAVALLVMLLILSATLLYIRILSRSNPSTKDT
jgi:multiple sugar transport system permease protein